jgi:hypothetical protein
MLLSRTRPAARLWSTFPSTAVPSRLVSLSRLALHRSPWFLAPLSPRLVFRSLRQRFPSPHLTLRYLRPRFLSPRLMLAAPSLLASLSRPLLDRNLWFLFPRLASPRLLSLLPESLSPRLLRQFRRRMLRSPHPRSPFSRHMLRFRLPEFRCRCPRPRPLSPRLTLPARSLLASLSRLLLDLSLWPLAPRLASPRPRYLSHRHMPRSHLLRDQYPLLRSLSRRRTHRALRLSSPRLRVQCPRLRSLSLRRMYRALHPSSHRLRVQFHLLPVRSRRRLWALTKSHRALSLRPSAPNRHALPSRLLLARRLRFLPRRLSLRARRWLLCLLPLSLEEFLQARLTPSSLHARCHRRLLLERLPQAPVLQCPRLSSLKRLHRAPPLQCHRLSFLERSLRAQLILCSPQDQRSRYHPPWFLERFHRAPRLPFPHLSFPETLLQAQPFRFRRLSFLETFLRALPTLSSHPVPPLP